MQLASKNHPARRFGRMVKYRRRKQGELIRQFWDRFQIRPSTGSDIEFGLRIKQHADIKLIGNLINHLKLSKRDAYRFMQTYLQAVSVPSLTMKDIFTVEQLEPAFLQDRNKAREIALKVWNS